MYTDMEMYWQLPVQFETKSSISMEHHRFYNDIRLAKEHGLYNLLKFW